MNRLKTHLKADKEFVSYCIFIMEDDKLMALAEQFFISLFKPYLNSQLYKKYDDSDYDLSKYYLEDITNKLEFHAHKFISSYLGLKDIERTLQSIQSLCKLDNNE